MMGIVLGILSSKICALFGGGLFGFGAKVINFDKRAVAAGKKLPAWVWIALAVSAALVAGYFIHRHQVNKFRTETQRAQMAADNDHWRAKLAAAHADALDWKQKAEAKAAGISREERIRDEDTIRRNAAAADALGMRGAGAATSHCRPLDHPSARAGTGGHEQAAPVADAAGSQVSSGDWSIVPWKWLVQRGREHDDGIAENLAWRTNDARQREAAAKSLAEPAK
jgi:hypothetical protein